MEYRTMESPTAAASAFSKKLVNSHSFAGKSLYDGVFAAPTKAHSGVEDYGEIFGGPASSIPFLDVPELNDRKVPVDVRRSKLDYSEIFGGFGDFEFAVSHEELLGKPKKNKKAPSKTRSRSRSEAARPSGLPGTDQVLSDEASNEVIDGVKEYKMLYNKTRSMGKSEVNGVTHVAELRAVPGYAHLIDENGPAKMKGTGRPVSSVLSDTSRTVNFGAGMMENGHHRKLSFDVLPAAHGKQTSGGDGAMQNKFSKIQGTDLSDRLFEAYDTGSKSHQEKEVPHASKQSNAAHRRGDSQVSMDPKFRASSFHSSEREGGVYSPTYLDEEVDENSDAAASAAAVRKAIEEAQVRIKLAREMMERKKEGHQPRMKSVSESVKKTKSKQSRVEVNVKKFGETENSDEIALPDHTFAGMEKPNVVKAGLLTPDLDEKETLSSANEAVEVIYSENLTTSEANHRREGVQELESEKETDEEKKSFSNHEEIKTSEEQTEYENKLEAVSKSQADFEKLDSVNGNYGLKESEDRLKSVEGIQTQREDQTGEKLATSLEQPELKLPRKLEPWEANFEERGSPAENMRELEVLEKVNKDDFDELKDVHRWVDNQTSNNSVLKHEGLIKSENGSEMEEDAIFVETLMLEEFQRRLKEACLMAEHVDVLEVCGPTENEVKQVMCNADINETGSDEPEKLETGMAREVNFIKEVKEKLEDAENHDSAYHQEDNDDVLQEKFNTKETDVLEEISEWGKTERLEEEIAVGAEERKAELADQEHHVHENNPFNYVHKEDNLENEESFAQLIKAPDFVVHEVDEGITEETEAHSVSSSIEEESKSVELCNDSKGTMEHHAAGLATVFSESDESMMQMENAEDFLSSYKIESSAHTAETYLDQPKDDHHSQESDTRYRMEGHLEEVDCESGESNLEADDDEVAMAEKRSNHDSESSAEGSWADDRPDIQDSQTSCAAEMEGETKEIDKHTSCAGEMKVETKEIDNQASCAGEMKGETKAMDHIIKENQDHGNGSENDYDSQSKLEKEAEDCYPGVVVLEKENKRKIDEAEERKREKEKERIVVERAIREARERAFAEARERAEKAAAEKANQAYCKVTSEARGKLEKGSGEANDKAFLEAKLKAERAAVERATEEARERALEKALSEKTSVKSRNQAEKLDADKFYGSFRDNVTKQRVNDSHKGSGATGSSGHSSAANQGERFDGTNGESAQRCKARMERHRRTAERAAKALEEKNMRDLRAQREQAERNRLAESLDAEVKRWSSGKEKNLRALLSTLQYILGPDSGWQPIPLTDIIATAAVKKAYRKATLSVHPDKLQQRGASIQQKYICEKVFDLLKEAWNKFNAEER